MTEGLTGAELIAVERARQQLPVESGGEGWDAEHDRGHSGALSMAGAVYAMSSTDRVYRVAFSGIMVTVDLRKTLWPWEQRWWKPSPDDRVKELAKAGALIAASIDSLLAEQR